MELRDPLAFGAARVPTQFEELQGTFGFDLRLPGWRLEFTSLSWRGSAPSLDVRRLSGNVATGPEGWTFEQLRVTPVLIDLWRRVIASTLEFSGTRLRNADGFDELARELDLPERAPTAQAP